MRPADFHRLRADAGSWSRDGEWLVARWGIHHNWGRSYRLETAFQWDEPTPADPPSANAALAAVLHGSMRRVHRRIGVPGPLDRTTRANLPRLQALVAEHWPELPLRPVRVEASDATPSPGGDRIGVFFSGGVDSLYTLLTNRDRVDDLILLRGFDIGLEPELDDVWEEVVAAGREVAAETGTRLIPVRTNIRPLLEGLRCHWGVSHGAALAHVGLLLQPWLREIYIASSFDIEHVSPWGSHPETDPLWSTDTLRFIHHGIETNRLGKIRSISASPVALRTLRVCNNVQLHGTYNCGRCYKCLPTMLALDIAGALERCTTLPHRITPGDLFKRDPWMLGGRLFLGELRDWWERYEPENQFLPKVREIFARDGDPNEFRVPVDPAWTRSS